MKTIRKNFLALAIVFGLAMPLAAVFTAFTVTPAVACGETVQECNRNTHGIEFYGDIVIEDPIEVVVCRSYWDELDVGTYRGQQTRWWEPTMVYGRWFGDLPTVTSQCKTYWVRPGTEFRVYASCVGRVITTGVIRNPGTYYMN